MAGRYPGGALATMAASMTSWSSRRAEIATDQGRIVLEDFHHPDVATSSRTPGAATTDDAGAPRKITGDMPVIGRGYGHEIAEVGRCIEGGLRESPLVPHAQTLTIMRQMDDVRRQVGVAFPTDSDR